MCTVQLYFVKPANCIDPHSLPVFRIKIKIKLNSFIIL